MTEILSQAAGPTDAPLLDQTLGANLLDTVAAAGDREALVDFPSGRRWTYAELLNEVDAIALSLLSLVHIVDAFPMTITGKVRKVDMREAARDLLG